MSGAPPPLEAALQLETLPPQNMPRQTPTGMPKAVQNVMPSVMQKPMHNVLPSAVHNNINDMNRPAAPMTGAPLSEQVTSTMSDSVTDSVLAAILPDGP